MIQKNQVSILVTTDKQARLNKLLKDISDELRPDLLALTPDEKLALAKMGDISIPFVERADGYCVSNPEFAPIFLDLEEMHKDVTAYQSLKPFLDSLTMLQTDLRDTLTVAGSEAFAAARVYYNSVTYAAKNGSLSAKVIAEELGKRYPGTRKPVIDPAKSGEKKQA